MQFTDAVLDKYFMNSPAHAGPQQMSGQLDEVLCAEWPLETNQIGTEQALENVRSPG